MTFFRSDYQKPNFDLVHTNLTFTLNPKETVVETILTFENARPGEEIFLNGEELELDFISVSTYRLVSGGLFFTVPSTYFQLKTIVKIHPDKNTALMGLYLSNGLLTTQNEPQGFRRITYFPDRPDVMSLYTVKIKAPRQDYPIRLSNGNIVQESEEEITFEDPFKKPSYLFALVAGNLDELKDTYLTKSGKKVDLHLYCEVGKKERLTYAMGALKRAMEWDEDTFGLEYDLNRFSIVAVSHFNAGAMENKSLNIFNDSLLLASPMITTDKNYIAIERCIGHEYFHNYSGDRITLKDWFNLSLKESLTVYRDSEFTYTLHFYPTERMDDVFNLRHLQYPEDDGPLAHPILLEKAESVDNFYTTTIYEKGAEVIRMMREVVGYQNFMKGCALYFERHDGQAVEISDFVRAIEEASGQDLSQFMLWYHLPKRPVVEIKTHYENNTFTVQMKQSPPLTKEPFVIPLAYGLVGQTGQDLLNGTIVLDKTEDTFTFDVIEKPVLSINRHFSAFVDIKTTYTPAERIHLMNHDSDLFNRYEIGHQYALESFVKMMQEKQENIDETLISMMGNYLTQETNPAFKACALTLPTDTEIINLCQEVDVDKLQSIRHLVKKHFADKYQEVLKKTYQDLQTTAPFELTQDAMGKRALKNILLGYLAWTNQNENAFQQYQQANNFTDLLGALAVLVHHQMPQASWALNDFYERYKNDSLTLNKWFMIQATMPIEETVRVVKSLINHPAFEKENPNRIRALLGGFCSNTVAFHTKEGYNFIADQIIKLDKINPHMASRLAENFRSWKKMSLHLRVSAEKALNKLIQSPLSPTTKEIIEKIVA